MQDLPINSEVGLGIVAAYLVIKEFISAIKRKDKEITVHPDQDMREVLNELSKLVTIQTEILRNIADNQKEIYKKVLERPSGKNFDSMNFS